TGGCQRAPSAPGRRALGSPEDPAGGPPVGAAAARSRPGAYDRGRREAVSARAPALPRRGRARGRGGAGLTPVRRLVALLAIMVLGVSGIVVRLVQLQVRDASAYQTLAWDQRVHTIDLPASRGSIF